jgi:C4-dicarboxylate transporter DctQ subunit
MFLRVVNRAEEAAICFLLLATTSVVFFDVVLRFGFNTGFMWTTELSLTLSAWMVLFGVSYGLKVGSHIGMDAFVKLFPRNTQRLLTGIGVVLALIYCWLILYGSWVYITKMKAINLHMEDLPIPLYVSQAIMPIGILFLSVRLFILLWNLITGTADGFKRADEAKESLELAEEIVKGEGRS